MLKNKKSQNEDHWLSVSDLMAGLMMVFLFISIAYMYKTNQDKQNMKNIAQTYESTQIAIYYALEKEFKSELEQWDATIDKNTLTFVFSPKKNPWFDDNKAQLKREYKKIIKEFFPRYLDVLLNEKFKNSISAIRIEGHTSSSGTYFHNMKLSQDRTRTVLEYIYNLREIQKYREWIQQHVSAVGLSYSKLILNEKTGLEDKGASRRVEFRIITNSEAQIKKILEIK